MTPDRAARRLVQTSPWDPLDLTDPGLPPVASVADAIETGDGILPDAVTRPSLHAVRAVSTPAAPAPSAPWER